MPVLLKQKLNIDFLKMKNAALMLSGVVIILGLGSLLIKGPKGFGVDFTGGCLHHLRFEGEVDIEKIREGLKTLGLGNVPIQQFGGSRDVILKAPLREGLDSSQVGKQINDAIRRVYQENPFEVMRTEGVGPAVGTELRKKAVKAAVLAVVCIVIYVAFRFEVYYALGALVALAHDALVTLGICSLFGIEISLNVIAAILTVLGYSINDTIVIFDRIREERKLKRGEELYSVINSSINHTLNRTVITSLTTLLVAACLFVFGGEVIRDFSFAMLVGIITGTYSSIYIASGILILFRKKLEKA